MTRAALPVIALALLTQAAPAAVVEREPQAFRGWCFEPDDITRDPLASILPAEHPWQRQERSRYFETPPPALAPLWVGRRTRRASADDPRRYTPAGGASVETPAPIPLPAIGSGLVAAMIGAALMWWRMR